MSYLVNVNTVARLLVTLLTPDIRAIGGGASLRGALGTLTTVAVTECHRSGDSLVVVGVRLEVNAKGHTEDNLRLGDVRKGGEDGAGDVGQWVAVDGEDGVDDTGDSVEEA